METALLVALASGLGASVFFWGRGIVKARKDDLIAGFAIQLILCLVLFIFATSSGVFSLIGLLVGGFGIATFVLSFFASSKCPLKRWVLRTLGALVILLGLMLCVIV